MNSYEALYDQPSRTVFEPTREDYANLSLSISESFAWQDIIDELNFQPGQYAVLYVFRSVQYEGMQDRLELQC